MTEATAGQHRFEQAQRDNPDHPYLDGRSWDNLPDHVKAAWEKLAQAEGESP